MARHPDKYQVFALTANRNIELLVKQCQQFKPQYAVLPEQELAQQLQSLLADKGLDTQVLFGAEQLEFVASHPQVDTVMAAIVGAAGLLPTLAAVKASKKSAISQ